MDEPNGPDPLDPSAGNTLDATDQATLSRGSPPSGARVAAGPSPRLFPGALFGSYRLLRLLGSGAFGQVWEGESAATGRRVAVKVLTAARALQDGDRQRFEREGRLAASVSHPNCVYVFGAEQIEGQPVIVMELVAGGTLQDKLRRDGPLPSRLAVDHALDILEGLDAANSRGVIHRDVKPSNCFLDEAGHAKVGDFGLSRTLDVDSELTATGVFLGTPSYASPEQVKAQELDFRSDLYSVGATLYALLTGKPPFEGSQLGQVLARILSEPPTPFEKHGARVTPGLQRVVFRMMAKAREKRFASYAAARAALLPFSSRGLGAASLARRFAALVVDSVALSPLSFTLMYVQGQLASVAAQFLYFLLLEKLWGHTLGKRLFGLRVVSADGADMSWTQAAVRTVTFVAIFSLPAWPSMFLSEDRYARYAGSGAAPLVMLVGYGLLCATMRRGNGYAGLHERASRTRVMALHESAGMSAPPDGERLAAAAGKPASAALGPFEIQGAAWETPNEALLVGRDPVLDRPVLVHRAGAGAMVPAIPSLAEPGPGRLQWLQGAREADGSWDAYEAPAGASLRDWVARRGALGWDDLAALLRSLLAELDRRGRAPSEYGPLSLSRVWVDSLGRGRVLDFAVDQAAAEEETFTADAWRPFLHQLVLFVLTGKAVPRAQLGGEVPRLPLPEHARAAISRLCAEAPGDTPATLGVELDRAAAQPGAVRRGRRAAALALSGAWLLFIGLIALVWLQGSDVMSAMILLKGGLNRWERNEALGASADPAQREALAVVLADAYRRASAMAARTTSLTSLEGQFTTIPARNLLGSLSAKQKALLEEVSARHPTVDAQQLERAQKTARFNPPSGARFSAMLYATLSVPVALIGLVGALAARGGLSLRMGGIAVQGARGEPASRLRCLLRAVVAWLPVLLMLLVFFVPPVRPHTVPLVAASAAASVLGALYALWRPARGLQDRLAGTWLVPR